MWGCWEGDEQGGGEMKREDNGEGGRRGEERQKGGEWMVEGSGGWMGEGLEGRGVEM